MTEDRKQICSTKGQLTLLLPPLTKIKLNRKSRKVWSIWNTDVRTDTYMDSGVEVVDEVQRYDLLLYLIELND